MSKIDTPSFCGGGVSKPANSPVKLEIDEMSKRTKSAPKNKASLQNKKP